MISLEKNKPYYILNKEIFRRSFPLFRETKENFWPYLRCCGNTRESLKEQKSTTAMLVLISTAPLRIETVN